jgi:hypothetical protein
MHIGLGLRITDIAVLTASRVPSWVLRSGAVPATLDIDFVNDRAWLSPAVSSVASLLACSRASSGYYTKADGTLTSFSSNTPRTGTNGLLVEEARTNNLKFSSAFDDATWTPRRTTVTAAAATAPDGTLTAYKLTPTAVSGDHAIRSNDIVDGNTNAKVQAVYVKPVGYTKFCIRESSSSGNVASFLLSGAGSVLDATGTATGSVEAIGNGWYRAAIYKTAQWASVEFYVCDPAYTSGNPEAVAWTGDGSSGIYIWGAQHEEGAFYTSYIPTTSASATRNADIITFSSLTWLDGANDSIYAEWVAKNVNNAKVWAFDATNDKLLDEQTGMSARIAGATVGNTASAGATVKAAARMSLNDFAISMNGGTVATDVSETAPGTLSASRLGVDLAGSNSLNSYIRRVAAFKGSALGNTALQALAT